MSNSKWCWAKPRREATASNKQQSIANYLQRWLTSRKPRAALRISEKYTSQTILTITQPITQLDYIPCNAAVPAITRRRAKRWVRWIEGSAPCNNFFQAFPSSSPSPKTTRSSRRRSSWLCSTLWRSNSRNRTVPFNNDCYYFITSHLDLYRIADLHAQIGVLLLLFHHQPEGWIQDKLTNNCRLLHAAFGANHHRPVLEQRSAFVDFQLHSFAHHLQEIPFQLLVLEG